jgi:hypothetical protein
MNPATHPTRLTSKTGWIILLLGGAICFAGFLIYQRATAVHDVHFILPTGFRGRVWLCEDPKGERLRPAHGRITIRVPPSGVVRLHDTSFLEQWHITSAEDDAGRKIADDLDQTPNKLGVFVFELESGVSQYSGQSFRWDSCFFGSPAERDVINKSGDISAFDELRTRLNQEPNARWK